MQLRALAVLAVVVLGVVLTPTAASAAEETAVAGVGVSPAAAPQYDCEWCENDLDWQVACLCYDEVHSFTGGGVDNKDCEGPDGCHEAWVENGCDMHPDCPFVPEAEIEALAEAAVTNDAVVLRQLIAARPQAITVVFRPDDGPVLEVKNCGHAPRTMRLAPQVAKLLAGS